MVFTKHIFTPLLGESFVAQVKAVHIPADQITRLNDCLGRIRPRKKNMFYGVIINYLYLCIDIFIPIVLNGYIRSSNAEGTKSALRHCS